MGTSVHVCMDGAWVGGHMKRPKVETIRQAPNTLIAHLQIASPPALLHEPSPTLASVNNLSILEKLKCALCSNALSQPLELMCAVHWYAPSASQSA